MLVTLVDFYIFENPIQVLANQSEIDTIISTEYKKVVDHKHKYDTKLNQLKVSLGLEKKVAIDLKSHISNFIRYNYLFEEESADNATIAIFNCFENYSICRNNHY